jgi:hypothetical protein
MAAGKYFRPPGLKPVFGLARMAGRAAPVAAAVIDIGGTVAVGTMPDMPAEFGGATAGDVVEGAAMRRQQVRAIIFEVVRTEAPDYLGEFRAHGSTPGTDEVAGDVGDRPADKIPDGLGEMEIPAGGPGIGVSEQYLGG